MSHGRRRGRRAGALALALAGASCVRERERLDPPRVTLELRDTAAAPGGNVSGTVTATDRDGVIYVAVTATAGDSSFRQRADVVSSDSVSFDFSLHVAVDAPDGAPIAVRATAIDEQSFQVEVADTAHVRTSVP